MNDANGGAASATPPDNAAANPASQTTTGAPETGPSSFQDYVQTLPDDLKAHATQKGWKDWGDAIKAHASAEKLIGSKVDAPKAGDAEAMRAHLVKIGAVPADGNYGLAYDADLAEGVTVDEGMKGAFEAFLKENPVPQSAAQNLVKMWNGMAAEAHKAQAKAEAAKATAKDAALEEYRGELGPDKFEAELNLATKAAAYGEFPDDLLNKLEDVLGTKTFIQCMARIGRLGTEDQFVEGTAARAPANAKSDAQVFFPASRDPLSTSA